MKYSSIVRVTIMIPVDSACRTHKAAGIIASWTQGSYIFQNLSYSHSHPQVPRPCTVHLYVPGVVKSIQEKIAPIMELLCLR